MLEAAERREAEDLDGALRDYELVIESFAQSSCAAEALLRVAMVKYESLADVPGAAAAAERLVTEHPISVSAADGHVLLGRIRVETAVATAHLEQGRESLRRAWVLFPSAQYPELEARSAARVLDGETAYRLGDLDGAAESFLAAIEDEVPSRWLVPAELGLATVLLDVGQWQAGAELLQATLDRLTDEDGTQEGSEAELLEWRETVARRLTLVHRLRVRPLAQEKPWTLARPLPLASTGILRPEIVAAHEDGRLIVAGGPQDRAAVVDDAGKLLKGISGVEVRCLMWTVDAHPYRCGKDVIAGITSPRQQRFLDPRKGNKPLSSLARVEQGGLGVWYVLADKRLQKFDNDGAHDGLLEGVAGWWPVDLAVDRRHRLYVLDRKNNKVFRFEADGRRHSTVASGSWKRPTALALDAFGDIFVLDEERGIDVFAPDGSRLAHVGLTLPGGISLSRPVDLAVDGRGRIFVVDTSLKKIITVD